jgi:serpin B
LAVAGGELPGDNITVSPLSLALALAMLENGARGATLTQISSTLGTSSLDPTSTNQGWASLVDILAAEAKADGIDLASANALWLQSALPVVPQFMGDLARYFRTGIWQVDFAHDLSGALEAINSWV